MLRILAREGPTPTWDELTSTAAAGGIAAPGPWQYRVHQTPDGPDIEVVRHVETTPQDIQKYTVVLRGWRDGICALLTEPLDDHPYLPLVQAWQQDRSKSAQPCDDPSHLKGGGYP